MAHDQSTVEEVAEEPCGQLGYAPGGHVVMQNHQVNIAKRGQVATPVTPVSNQGDPPEQIVMAIFTQVSQCGIKQLFRHGVSQVGDPRADFNPREPLIVFFF